MIDDRGFSFTVTEVKRLIALQAQYHGGPSVSYGTGSTVPDSLLCRDCLTPVYRPAPHLLIPSRCPECGAKKVAATDAELAKAIKEGERRSRYRAWQDRLFVEHRNGHHKTHSTPGCEPCSIAHAVESVEPEDSEIPRALR
jgi:rubredoxin